MSAILGLKDLERETYPLYSKDGLWDITTGRFMLTFGLDMLFEWTWSSFSFLWLLLLGGAAKRGVTYD